MGLTSHTDNAQERTKEREGRSHTLLLDQLNTWHLIARSPKFWSYPAQPARQIVGTRHGPLFGRTTTGIIPGSHDGLPQQDSPPPMWSTHCTRLHPPIGCGNPTGQRETHEAMPCQALVGETQPKMSVSSLKSSAGQLKKESCATSLTKWKENPGLIQFNKTWEQWISFFRYPLLSFS